MSTKTYRIAQIAELLGCSEIPCFQQDSPISWLGHDSRKIGDAKATLFFALLGRRDGHDYLAEAYKKGVRHFVVSKDKPYGGQFPGANFLLVPDTLKALQALAAHHRTKFHYPVVAITGSNGKTVVKEWLYELLSPDYRIARSPKSYNSQLGVALSLWNMDDEADLALIEAGISQVGEMQALQAMIQPTMGILTNIGTAHDAGFDHIAQKAQEKLLLFAGVSTLIYNPKYLHGQHIPQVEKTCTWGQQGSEDLFIISYEQTNGGHTAIKAKYAGEQVSITVPFTDAASLENVICCWATLLALGYDQRTIAQRVASLSAIGMRLELKNGINNCSIIDDSYSNDISSLEIALDFLSQQQQHQAKVLILSDMPVQGLEEATAYQRVAALVNRQRLSLFIGIGEQLSRYRHLFAGKTAFYPSTATFLASGLSFQQSTILLKGARIYSFEKISQTLSLQMHDTILEINLNALENNLNQYRALLPEGVKLMAMVKAFSYGSGSFEIANVLQFNKVDYLTVAYADEGIALRRAGITLPIMVMNAGIQNLEMLLRYQLEPEIYSLHELESLAEAIMASENNQQEYYAVHLKLDTGMHRLGFAEEELEKLIEFIHHVPSIRVKSVFSHLVASGDAQHDDYTRQQIALFERMSTKVKASLSYDIWMHIANTSAISRFPEASFDMVRLGIGLYGVSTDDSQPVPLSTVATLKTKITQIKQIQAGDTVGYNRHGRLKGDGSGQTATVKIGYADGYSRRLGNGQGYMLINGQQAYTVGDICMDMCMLDITEVPDIKEGDEVIVMGEKPHVTELARAMGTIPYEVLTGISPRVKRVYYYE